jgi:hypothetical protein
MRKLKVGLTICIAALAMSAAAQTVTGSGTSGTIPVFTGSSTIGTSNPAITESSGNVGIGNVTPSGNLDVNAPSYGIGTGKGLWIYQGGNPGNGGIAIGTNSNLVGSFQSLGSNSSLDFLTNLNGTPFDAMRINPSGFVGIGTTTPGGTLDVLESGGQEVAVGGGSTTGSEVKFLYLGVSHFSIYNSGNGDLTIANTSALSQPNTAGTPLMSVSSAGYVGIGTTAPASLLSVGPSSQFQVSSAGAVTTPSITFTGATGTQTTPWTGVLCGGDYAEAVNAKGALKTYEPGDVLVIGDGADGEVQKSTDPYSTMVAGIYATKPGVIGRRQTLLKEDEELPMAMIGIVPSKVTAENGPIHRGDLLVTSSTTGYAMKGTDRSRLVGAVIGKAMGSLETGTGVIEVLVTLQ